MNLFKSLFIGHLGQDATFNEEKKVINFSLAIDQSYKKENGEKVEKTEWVQCAYWTSSDAVLQFLKKGSAVYVEGKPGINAYINKAGEIISNLTLKVDHLSF